MRPDFPRSVCAWGAVWVIALLAVALGGCDETRKRSLKAVADHYRAGHFRRALVDANAVAEQASGHQYDQARYFAGLSAYRLGRDEEAEGYLRPLADHRDARIAGPTHVTLGLIALSRHEDQQALRHFTDATESLEASEAGKAHYHMALCQQKLGLWSTAQAHLEIALHATTDPDLRRVIRQRLAARAFTIQLGAYGRRANADQRAHELAGPVSRAGLGVPTIVPSLADGRRLYLVQAGRFNTHADARRALERLRAGQAWIVTTDAAR